MSELHRARDLPHKLSLDTHKPIDLIQPRREDLGPHLFFVQRSNTPDLCWDCPEAIRVSWAGCFRGSGDSPHTMEIFLGALPTPAAGGESGRV